MPKPVLVERAELVVWRDRSWRCEMWIVNGAPRLRLFRNGIVTRDFGVEGKHEAIELGATWRVSAETYHAEI